MALPVINNLQSGGGRLFNSGDDMDSVTAFTARFGVDLDIPLQHLCSSHCGFPVWIQAGRCTNNQPNDHSYLPGKLPFRL